MMNKYYNNFQNYNQILNNIKLYYLMKLQINKYNHKKKFKYWDCLYIKFQIKN